MRNMFGGPPPDRWGEVFAIASLVIAFGGLLFVGTSQSKLKEATETWSQRLALLLLVLANLLPVGQILIAILMYLS